MLILKVILQASSLIWFFSVLFSGLLSVNNLELSGLKGGDNNDS